MRLIILLKRLARRVLSRLFPSRVYYINGSDTLPPPLSAEDEAYLLSRFTDPAKRDGIRRTLIERNLRLVVYIARKFDNTGVMIEDMISIGTIGLIKAINTFSPERNIKLATYASRCIENEILMHLRKISGKRYELSIDEPLNTDCDGNELLLSDVLASSDEDVGRTLERESDRGALLAAVETLPERERRIISLRFGLYGSRERTQKEVADMLGISQSYISRLEKRIMNRLRRELEPNIK